MNNIHPSPEERGYNHAIEGFSRAMDMVVGGMIVITFTIVGILLLVSFIIHYLS